MQFAEKCMSLTDVNKKNGVPKPLLYSIANTPGQRCAFRMSATGKGKIWFDTDRLSKELDKRLSRN